MADPKRTQNGPVARFAPRVVPAGDSALMLELAAELDLEANAAAHAIADDVRKAQLDGVTDVVAAIVTVTVFFRAETSAEAAARRAAVIDFLMAALARTRSGEPAHERAPVEIPVCYERPFAPDLEEVAERTGLSTDDVIARHAGTLHRVLMIGFAPGFPYLGGLDPRLAAVTRRSTPRARLEAGSVAIANGQSVIYPFATPGGWNLIGRTPLRLFDPLRATPSLLAAGDRVKFIPIGARDFERLARTSTR
jgi:inhibitor of KinA